MEPLNEVNVDTLAWFTGDVVSVVNENNSGGLMLTRHGLVMTREDVNELYQKAMTFIDHVGDEFIEYENQCAIERKSNRGAAKPKERKPRAGWVYVVQIVGDNLYKIGMTTNKPDSRLAQFVPKMPYEAVVLATVKTGDALGVERLMHEHYKDFRENGEWFRFSDGVLDDFLDHLGTFED
jgi:hypothetical protein